MNILKEDYTHVITHNPLPIPKEQRGGSGRRQGENRDRGQNQISQLNPGCPGAQP